MQKRGLPALRADLGEDPLRVFFSGADADAEDFGDVSVALGFGHPMKHFRLACGQPEGAQCRRGLDFDAFTIEDRPFLCFRP